MRELKRIAVFSLPLFLLANTVTTGRSYSKSTVKTEIEGEGKVYTRIEVEANGEKKVLESSEPGEHSLEVSTPANLKIENSTSSTTSLNLPQKAIESATILQTLLVKIKAFFRALLNFTRPT